MCDHLRECDVVARAAVTMEPGQDKAFPAGTGGRGVARPGTERGSVWMTSLGVEQLCLGEELGSERPASLSVCPQRPHDCCLPLTNLPRGRREPCDVLGGASLRAQSRQRPETDQQTLPSRQEKQSSSR